MSVHQVVMRRGGSTYIVGTIGIIFRPSLKYFYFNIYSVIYYMNCLDVLSCLICNASVTEQLSIYNDHASLIVQVIFSLILNEMWL